MSKRETCWAGKWRISRATRKRRSWSAFRSTWLRNSPAFGSVGKQSRNGRNLATRPVKSGSARLARPRHVSSTVEWTPTINKAKKLFIHNWRIDSFKNGLPAKPKIRYFVRRCRRCQSGREWAPFCLLSDWPELKRLAENTWRWSTLRLEKENLVFIIRVL